VSKRKGGRFWHVSQKGFGKQLHRVKLFGIVLVACLILIANALVIHRIPPVREYPKKAD